MAPSKTAVHPDVMRIAVIADTHDRYPPRLLELLRSADEIWHLGDVCEPSILHDFEQLRRPLKVVLGNNDTPGLWPLTMNLRRSGVRFHLIHIPPPHPPLHCDVIVHGHTHAPRDEMLGGVRWLNPGCISRPNRGFRPSFGWLSIDRHRHITWELVRL